MKVAIVCNDEVGPFLAHLGYTFSLRRKNFHLYLSEADAFIIQATVLVDTEKYTNWEGLKLIERLRREYRCQQPIILTSWRNDLLVEMQVCDSLERLPERRIFLDPLVRFVPLSNLISTNSEVVWNFFDPPLDSPGDCLSFDEMVRIVYEQPSSYVRELFHRLYARLEQHSGPFRQKNATDLVFDELIQLQQILQDRSINVIRYLERFRADASQAREKGAFYSLLTQLQGRLSSEIAELKSGQSDVNIPKEQHILFVDDMAEDRNKLSTLLKPYQIIVHAVSNLSEAEQSIASFPEICAVLCDFRLYDRYGRIARQQGSQIMRILQQSYPDLYFGYLSSYYFGKSDLHLSNEVELFHKHSIFSGEQPEFGRFIQRIFQKAEEKRNVKRYIGHSLKKKSIGACYLTIYETSPEEFRSINREIDRRALKIFLDYKNRIYQEAGFAKGFQTHFKKKDSEKKRLEKLKLKLLCRRVIIALLQLPLEHFDQTLPSNIPETKKRQVRFSIIYNFLMGDHTHQGTHYKSKQDIYNNYLGIKTGKTYNLSRAHQETRELVFPEEWIWLQVNRNTLTQ